MRNIIGGLSESDDNCGEYIWHSTYGVYTTQDLIDIMVAKKEGEVTVFEIEAENEKIAKYIG